MLYRNLVYLISITQVSSSAKMQKIKPKVKRCRVRHTPLHRNHPVSKFSGVSCHVSRSRVHFHWNIEVGFGGVDAQCGVHGACADVTTLTLPSQARPQTAGRRWDTTNQRKVPEAKRRKKSSLILSCYGFYDLWILNQQSTDIMVSLLKLLSQKTIAKKPSLFSIDIHACESLNIENFTQNTTGKIKVP
jgi:hypothetical protein